MNDLIDKAPELIREAAKSTLGLLALIVVAVSILSLAFFTTASEVVRVLIFVLLLIGAGLFTFSVYRLAALERSAGATTPSMSSSEIEHKAISRGADNNEDAQQTRPVTVIIPPANYGTKPYPTDIIDSLKDNTFAN